MVKIKWTHNAIEELDDIANYISKDSPKYALILVKQIYEMVSHLEKFPKFGRKVPLKIVLNTNLTIVNATLIKKTSSLK